MLFLNRKKENQTLWRKFALKLRKEGLCWVLFTAPKKIYSYLANFHGLLNLSTCYCLRVKTVPEQAYASHSYSPVVCASFPQFN